MKLAKALCFYCAAYLASCTDSGEKIATGKASVCEIRFSMPVVCQVAAYSVELRTEKIAADERRLIALHVSYVDGTYMDGTHVDGTDMDGIDRTQVLEITQGTTFLNGDTGFITAEDINFDGHPDLAITTSFGTPNLYLDYWVFDVETKTLLFVGNYSRFQRDVTNRTLHTRIKINAARYREEVYIWRGNTLVRQ